MPAGTTAADLCLYVATAQKVNPLWIIVGFFVIGIAGYACGLLETVRLLYTTGAFWPRFLSGGLMTITDWY